MNYYLVDYENVNAKGLAGVDGLSENDVVCIFYSKNADSITFDLHRQLNESKANISIQKVDVGLRNALDFQLASYLGYVIRENMDIACAYYVVTKDRGYESLVNYWKKRNVPIQLAVDVTGQSEQSEQVKLENQVAELIDDQTIVSEVAKLIRDYKTKQGLNNALMKKFPSKDNKKSSTIYTAIKPLIANKKGK